MPDLSALPAVWDQLWPWITAITALASLLDAALPQPAAGSHWLPPRKLLSAVALNLARAGNSGQPSLSTWVNRLLAAYLAAHPEAIPNPPPAGPKSSSDPAA